MNGLGEAAVRRTGGLRAQYTDRIKSMFSETELGGTKLGLKTPTWQQNPENALGSGSTATTGTMGISGAYRTVDGSTLYPCSMINFSVVLCYFLIESRQVNICRTNMTIMETFHLAGHLAKLKKNRNRMHAYNPIQCLSQRHEQKT